MLRNLRRFITEQPCGETLLRRQVVEKLGLDTAKIIDSTSDRLGDKFI